MYAQYLFNL
jgi:hypothetical protein